MFARWSNKLSLGVATAAFLVAAVSSEHRAWGQGQGGFNGFLFNRVVGGVHFDAHGVLAWKPQQVDRQLVGQLQQQLQQVDHGLAQQGLRFVSLKQIHHALTEMHTTGTPIPLELAYLAGIQRLEYLVVRPAENDILLAGYGEGWKLNDQGQVVGATTGAPVLHLEDLLTAFRTVDEARSGNGISVSIEPTPEGARQAQELLSRMAQARQFDPSWAPQVEQAMGANVIALTGVPENSRYAQVLAAADHKMKRLSMGLESTSLKNFPSLLELLQQRDGIMNSAPRFWMECNYQPVARSEDGLVWQLRGSGVKTLTDDQFFDQHGISHATGKTNPFAQRWAETMTERFDELAQAEPVFAELRNVMDMSLIAALIAQENLLSQASLSIPHVTQSESPVALPNWPAPKTVPAQCSYVAVRGHQNVFVSGGVLVDSWGAASRVETVAAVGAIAQRVGDVAPHSLWWNAAE